MFKIIVKANIYVFVLMKNLVLFI